MAAAWRRARPRRPALIDVLRLDAEPLALVFDEAKKAGVGPVVVGLVLASPDVVVSDAGRVAYEDVGHAMMGGEIDDTARGGKEELLREKRRAFEIGEL